MAEETTRTKSSAKNAVVSLVYYFISNIFTFIMRTFLVNNIGIEYAGLNSLLVNLIGMLNIAELGLSTAVGYSLYKPIADKDYKKMNEILCLYKYLYRIIAVVIAVIGIVITIFINSFVNTNINISEVRISFVLYLIATVASYLLTFINVLPSADQKNYIVVRIQNNGKIIKNILQLISIIVLKNFYVWLIIEIIASIFIYLYTNMKIKKMYDWYKGKEELTFKELITSYKDIVKRTKDLVFHKIGSIVVYQTDNILISKFDTLTGVGIYSNYMTIYTLLTGIVEQAFMGITASIRKFNYRKNRKRGI
ncbi:MAG: oligosaccharide flippase family protein [Clostridia bacterium]|nr:oligosaccharide flippase family protein [Clostridia bacterium]